MRPESGLHRFVRGLLGGAVATRSGDIFRLPDGRQQSAPQVMALIASGAIAGTAAECQANAQTSGWLKRQRLEADAFAAQHRQTVVVGQGTTLNLSESPLSRLASGEAAFLARHHVEAGERVRKLIERAQLQPRLTMAYSAASVGGQRPQAAGDISDFAADARRSVAEIHRLLPTDCAGVVIDVCGLLKGLQDVERERGWPRRSAKLVLRIGLEQLAQHYGFGPFAVGTPNRRPRAWLDDGARPERFE